MAALAHFCGSDIAALFFELQPSGNIKTANTASRIRFLGLFAIMSAMPPTT